MKTSDNTLFITGGASGIGRALAESFHRLGNKVIIAGRRQNALDEVTRAHPGISSITLDMTDAIAIEACAARLVAQYPGLNVVVHNAGIMRSENLLDPSTGRDDMESTVATNLLGPMRLTAALLPHLLKQPAATLVTVTSGLAFMPHASFPTYCSTKAALHSYTESLRYQLRDTTVEVLELVPPYVQTGLTGGHQAADPEAMPLADFITEAMQILSSKPTPAEILVERVKPLRFAAHGGNYATFFKTFNDVVAKNHKSETTDKAPPR